MKTKTKNNIFFFLVTAFLFFDKIAICGAENTGIPPPIVPRTLEELLLNILAYLKKIAGVISVIFIVIGGIMYMLSSGNVQRTERAKKTVTYAIVGLVIVVAAPVFLKEILSITGSNISGSEGPTLQQIALNILNFLLSIAGLLSIISTLIGAIWILTAYGNAERIELGKKTVAYSIIGTAIAISSLIIAQQVAQLVGS
jgi:type IV secretory pathway VirB2 component (pilin)